MRSADDGGYYHFREARRQNLANQSVLYDGLEIISDSDLDEDETVIVVMSSDDEHADNFWMPPEPD